MGKSQSGISLECLFLWGAGCWGEGYIQGALPRFPLVMRTREKNTLKWRGSVQSHPRLAQTLSWERKRYEAGVVSSRFYNLTVCGAPSSRSNAQCQSCNNRMQKRCGLEGCGLLCLWSRGLEQTDKSSWRFIWGWGRWGKPQVPYRQRCRDGGMGPGPLVGESAIPCAH